MGKMQHDPVDIACACYLAYTDDDRRRWRR
jgi:hypothetical protein